jgi:hypothetical protein
MKKRHYILGSAGLLVVIGGAFGIGRYTRAQHWLQLASAATRHDQLTEAAADLSQAHAAWPWVSIAAPQKQIAQAQMANANFFQGMNDMQQGDYKNAETYFASIPIGSTHYRTAQTWLRRIHAAFTDASTASRIIKNGTAVTSEINNFWTDFNTVTDTLNGIQKSIEAYYSYAPPSSAEIATANTQEDALDQDTQSLQTAIQTLSSNLSGLGQMSPWNHIPLNSLLTTANTVAEDTTTLDSDFSNDITTFSNGNTVSFSSSNIVVRNLEAAQVAYQNALSAFAGGVAGVLSTVLENSAHITQLLPSTTPPSTAPSSTPPSPSPSPSSSPSASPSP